MTLTFTFRDDASKTLQITELELVVKHNRAIIGRKAVFDGSKRQFNFELIRNVFENHCMVLTATFANGNSTTSDNYCVVRGK